MAIFQENFFLDGRTKFTNTLWFFSSRVQLFGAPNTWQSYCGLYCVEFTSSTLFSLWTCGCIASPVSGFALNLEDRFGTVVLNPWIAASLKVRLGRGFWFSYARLYNCWDENFDKNCRFVMFLLWLLKILELQMTIKHCITYFDFFHIEYERIFWGKN